MLRLPGNNEEILVMQTVQPTRQVPTYGFSRECGLIATGDTLPAGRDLELDPSKELELMGHPTRAFPLARDPETYVLHRDLGLPDLVE
jgi:hypothetical protein